MRIRYVKYEHGHHRYVLVDFNESGETHFADQEPGSPVWYSYTPSKFERRFAFRLAAKGLGAQGWKERLDLSHEHHPTMVGKAAAAILRLCSSVFGSAFFQRRYRTIKDIFY